MAINATGARTQTTQPGAFIVTTRQLDNAPGTLQKTRVEVLAVVKHALRNTPAERKCSQEHFARRKQASDWEAAETHGVPTGKTRRRTQQEARSTSTRKQREQEGKRRQRHVRT
ncbi:hypothetical protein TRVL_09192 [Trypanosoma vivax]|nr:hypothetical protein TRVL_09192 [Trypanosoma vivax]